jgi:hypothetical protein
MKQQNKYNLNTEKRPMNQKINPMLQKVDYKNPINNNPMPNPQHKNIQLETNKTFKKLNTCPFLNFSDQKGQYQNNNNNLIQNQINYQINNILQQEKEPPLKSTRYHISKYLDLNNIKKIMNNEHKLKDIFNEIVKQEEKFEEESFSLKHSVVGFLKESYKMKESENENTIKKHLKLTPYKQDKYKEQTILILISGYFSSESDPFKDWKKLIKVYKKRFNNPIIYFYNWPSSKLSLKTLLHHRKDFRDTTKRAEYCGKLLAVMIVSNIFDGFKINLSAFSLGNHVLKHCLKELEEFGKLNLINNVVFMAGATDIESNFKWDHRLSSVSGTVVNCYSNHDLALWYCRQITKKDTIGTKELILPNTKVLNVLISSFHILYRIKMNRLWKKFIDKLKE